MMHIKMICLATYLYFCKSFYAQKYAYSLWFRNRNAKNVLKCNKGLSKICLHNQTIKEKEFVNISPQRPYNASMQRQYSKQPIF